MGKVISKDKQVSRIRKTDIAVIGIAGRFPGADNPEEFWKNLQAGKSTVEEVPANRWEWEKYWGDPQVERNKSNSKWGGFLNGVENFDPSFFGLSAREVERMDPQQRIMLELAWSCFEDAGIRPSCVSGKKVGVFVGVFNFDYKELQESSASLAIEAHHSTGTASAIIANRISYYFNLKGPSFPIDTACSSSLNAIHCAIQSLLNGECTLAVAGGVNLLLTPTRHISFSKTGMLSPTGSCKTFDDSADGYVRGEGAGLLLLKPLAEAVKVQDNIYGIIKGSAVNHGGKTYSLTYPNPEAQKDVIVQAQQIAGVAPETISYIEAHGTGTPKGDPIEFEGLTKAFRSGKARPGTKRKGYCGLGSVKTNVGHLEAAAGVAGVIKVLLSMNNRQLPGLQNFKQINHRISVDDSPFYMVSALKEWTPLKEGNRVLPRRAGVSSFGFGGTNAHVVLEEAPMAKSVTKKPSVSPFFIACISAKTSESLLQRMKDLISWLRSHGSSIDVVDICKTLSIGREHFPHRVAIITEGIQDLENKLTLLTQGNDVEGCFASEGKKNVTANPLLKEAGKLVVETLKTDKKISRQEYYKKLSVMAELYASGHELEWDQPWCGGLGKRVSLPVYPFAKEKYWIPADLKKIETDVPGNAKLGLHPLLSQNTSNFQHQRFLTTITAQDFFIKDHVVKGKKLLPGVAYLEMIRAAVAESVKDVVAPGMLILRNIVWAQPVIVEDDAVEIYTSLTMDEEDRIAFSVHNGLATGNGSIVYCEGSAQVVAFKEHTGLSIPELKEEFNQKILGTDQCYTNLRMLGFDYGPAHQALETVYFGSHQLLAKLKLPQVLADTRDSFFLHPSILDAALQAALLISVLDPNEHGSHTYLPFALDSLEIISPCTQEMWVVVTSDEDSSTERRSSIRRLNFDLCDQDGKICVRMNGFSFKLLSSDSILSSAQTIPAGMDNTILLTPDWKQKKGSIKITSAYVQHNVFLIDIDNAVVEHVRRALPNILFLSLAGSYRNPAARYQHYLKQVFETVQTLLSNKPSGKILLQIIVPIKDEFNLSAGLSGLLKTAHLENPNFEGQVIEVFPTDNIVEIINENRASGEDDRVRYINRVRHTLGWKEFEYKHVDRNFLLKDQGVYLITGGAGGLGFIFAKALSEKSKQAVIVITGRSLPSAHVLSQINVLRNSGVGVEYRQSDVTDKTSLAKLINSIQEDFKSLNGIIHSAGVIRDNFIIRKSAEEVIDVASSKVTGVTYLDELTQDIPLDFFVVFSSVVGTLGNIGQSDYAAANAYLDQYAGYRNHLVKQNKRHGHTISINWPLWRDGGMKVEKPLEAAMLESLGMSLLETETGVKSFHYALASGESQIMVAPGNIATLKKKYLKFLSEASQTTLEKMSQIVLAPAAMPVSAETINAKQVIWYFKELLSAVIKRPVAKIDEEAAMEDYGIDSIMVMQMTRQMETVFGTLPKTLFFEYQNIRDLSHYFLENYVEKLRKVLVSEKAPGPHGGSPIQYPPPALSFEHNVNQSVHTLSAGTSKILPAEKSIETEKKSKSLDVAIIGVAGRYPQADNLQEFWNNLSNGKDCITEIPKDRWDFRVYFDEDKEQEGKSYSKWGGFINDVDKFDPLFFNITPYEAERMDPQERLFLQCVYETIEDAGYTRQTLDKKKQSGLGNNVGVYVGVMYEEYQLFGAQESLLGKPVALWGLPSSIANRVSYFCDFHGPSMAIDTMCSSSLTAIHLACESIARGKCEVAIAGGVNVSVHPNKYLFLSQGRFASSKGRCESFGVGGDGYVPGEGVGAVLLKSLADAIADGDHIYGIIKSTAINHGGKTNGYTVPNPKAQAGVIRNAFREANVDPRQISYIEAHGTGTSLGDPIEILALSKAFHEYTTAKQFCAIGSAKSNIGHCESAAGIAGVTKVLLQLKHKQLCPSLHSETLNTNIDFKNSPFNVQQELTHWPRPLLENEGKTIECPRIAGISSFGAGGANAHVVIEEYIANAAPQFAPQALSQGAGTATLILLSAKDDDRLLQRAEQLLSEIRKSENQFWKNAPGVLANIAYTLQVGREHMEARAAWIVESVYELEKQLDSFVTGKNGNKTANHWRQLKTSVTSREDADVIIQKSIEEKAYDKLLQLWLEGFKVDWTKLYDRSESLCRISLPSYPFKKERYWIGEVRDAIDLNKTSTALSFIHPLLHSNVSDLSAQRFSVTFTGNESYLTDHVVNGEKILPASAYLEMIREAVWQSLGSLRNEIAAIQLKDIQWTQPIVVKENPVEIYIELYLVDEKVQFVVYSSALENIEEREIYCEGWASISAGGSHPVNANEHIENLRRLCADRIVSGTDCYKAFENIGFQYGRTHQGLKEICIGDSRLLARIELPTDAHGSRNLFKLHPALVDAALQATLFHNARSKDHSLKMFLPVGVEEVTIYKEFPSEAWVLITGAGNKKGKDDEHVTRILDVSILNDAGEVCLFLKGVSLKATQVLQRPLQFNTESFLLVSEWKSKEVPLGSRGIHYGKRIIVIAGLKSISDSSTLQLPEADIMILRGNTAADFQLRTWAVFEKIQEMMKARVKSNLLVQVVISAEADEKLNVAFSGLLKTAQKENPGFFGHVIMLPEDATITDVKNKIQANSLSPVDHVIRYTNGNREVFGWKFSEFASKKGQLLIWKDNGVYLITGGVGGLGHIFAREIATQASGVTLLLTGRSPLDETKKSKIVELQQLGANVVYMEVHVNDQKDVQQLIHSIRKNYGNLNGILHSAGVIHDSYIIYKTKEEWDKVLGPKVNGVRYLDEATKDHHLDLFIFFSSISGAVGNAGQADYATANAFMDAYAEYRNTLVSKGLRYGNTLSINWPLWKDGGMHVSQDAETYLFDSMGIVALKTQAGISGLYDAIMSRQSQVMIVEGSYDKIQAKLITSENSPTQHVSEFATSDNAIDNRVKEESIYYFRKLLSSVIKLPVDKIKPTISMEEYGIDSVMVMKMTAKLEKEFGILSKTLFFEYQTIEALAHYFLNSHYNALAAILNISNNDGNNQAAKTVNPKNSLTQATPLIGRKRSELSLKSSIAAPRQNNKFTDIAIVGLSGKYPQADDLDQFWKNLCNGKDCITEIPEARWDYRLYFDADRNKTGKTYSKWGGFLNGVDEFDPLFFNISPLEAELLDPQERLFLQCAYETIEDAGYSRETLSMRDHNGLSGNVGVYVGVMYEEYQLFGAQQTIQGRNTALYGNPSSIANRVSYFYNFNGPSMAVDTMCSSSLTAIHLACQSIINGDCEAAIAGGVNISIHPNKYLLLAQGKFISGKGRCESFGVGGDGYVPGEGVGAVFLKPLTKAVADGDHIYGVIKGTSINHGGKTNGYTVPNPNAQAKVISKTYERSGIDPRTVSYIEAHGTGTSLGDPIEITGLKKAYEEFTSDHGFCAIGSVKSNIGHCESAAGMAGLTKILLQMKHRTLVPSLHSSVLNPNIEFTHSPFVVQQEISEWKKPAVMNNGQLQEYPRRAGLSSFGAGGSNAHMVIEEFENDQIPEALDVTGPFIIVLSAKNNDRLKEVTERFLQAIQQREFQDSDLPHIAFTLQTGRDALEARLAIIVNSVDELISKLKILVKGEDEEIEGVHHGKVERDNNAIEAFEGDDELQEAIEKWAVRKKYNKLCSLWVKGLPINWNILYKTGSGKIAFKRVSLPTYPFARERYWVPSSDDRTLGHTAIQITKPLDSAIALIGGKQQKSIGTILLQPYWKDSTVTSSGNITFAHHLILLAGDHKHFALGSDLESNIAGARIIKLDERGENLAAVFEDYSLQVLHHIQNLISLKLPGKILVQVAVPAKHVVMSALYALLKTVHHEHPQITGQLIEIGERESVESLVSILKENCLAGGDGHIRYKNSQRQISTLREHITQTRNQDKVWKEGGVYIITGGAGGIGVELAKEVLRHVSKVTIFLIGRSPLSQEKQDLIRSLHTGKANIIYKQVDISQPEPAQQLIRIIKQEFGRLNGIIHSAGVTRDKFIIHKTPTDFREVYASKVHGFLNLDEATKSLELDFFVVFSSIAGVLGNPGQADYATANAFMDRYVQTRNHFVASQLRNGHTLAINWPLWKDGGMHVDKNVEEYLENKMGILPMDTTVALEAFYNIFSSSCDQLMPLYGDRHTISSQLLNSKSVTVVSPAAKNIKRPEVNNHNLIEKTLWGMKDLFGQTVKLNAERVDEKEEFQAYGLNSVMIVQLNHKLESIFGELSKTLFYEYQNLSELTKYLVEEHQASCFRWVGSESEAHSSIDQMQYGAQQEHSCVSISSTTDAVSADRANGKVMEPFTDEPIAIIGISGRYPKAESLRIYWENLKSGIDCITEVPNDRWPGEEFYHEDKEKAIELGKSYSKWGGFLEGFADFDPLFFNISPREAVAMDPQERIFLQMCWQVFEDAGYTREQIAKKYNGNVGVFAGVTKTGFELYSPDLWRSGDEHRLRTSFSSVSNRVSYHLNLHGPSIAIDTMCSASLTAIYEACENLQRGTCAMAIAGGVNLYLHPLNYIDLCSQSFLSADGKCRSFGRGGNGFVPGEGVGAVLLKPLSKAIADGDVIQAVIKSASVNHGGKTSGYTVPNPVAQAELIRVALDKAKMSARSISYVEAHGTGTSLGDPIEITGLSKAFRKDTTDVQFCSIGSAKSNIGHLEAAAGIAGITKIILQMKYGMLVPSLHASEVNENINFAKSPFVIQQKLTPWNRPELDQNGIKKIVPRAASISSFGAGGSNAHIILEEYIPKSTTSQLAKLVYSGGEFPALIVLSARDKNRLTDQAKQLLNFISDDEFNHEYDNLINTAYTLQVGREAMEERLALKVNSVNELKEKLARYVSGEENVEALYHRCVSGKVEHANDLDTLIHNRKFDNILQAWVTGVAVEWERLYATLKYPQVLKRIGLPTYPFAKTKYWLPASLSKRDITQSIQSTTLAPPTEGTKVELSIGNISQPGKQWLFTKEEWISSPVNKNIDWNKSIRAYNEKKICIVYRELEDAEGLKNLLGKLSKAANIKQVLDISLVHLDHLDAHQIKAIRPEVVLVLGPRMAGSVSLDPIEDDLHDVFNVSQCLMQAMWGDAVRLYYFFETDDNIIRLDCEALSGFFRSAMKENDQHIWRSVRLHNIGSLNIRHQLLLKEWLSEDLSAASDSFKEVLVNGEQRLVKELLETQLGPSLSASFRIKGTYLVAGGMGYIGGLLLQELARKYKANLIIISKGLYNGDRKRQCAELEQLGAKVHYYVGDITDMSTLRPIYEEVKNELGDIHGVINLARAHDSKSIISKSWESFFKTSQVKIQGTLNLDELTKDEPLDVFILFASIGAYGARGDCDYAYSVAYQNAFARYRNEQRRAGNRQGVAVSQCWGPWVEDKLFPESRKKMSFLGLDLIDMSSAFPLIEATCSYENSVIGLCAISNLENAKQVLGIKKIEQMPSPSVPVEKHELLVSQWEREKVKANGKYRGISVDEIQKSISVQEMKNLDAALIERIYKLCADNIHSTDEHVAEEKQIRKNDQSAEKTTGLNELKSVVRSCALEVLQLQDINEAKAFQHYGLDSIMAMRLSISIGKKLKLEILPQWLIEHQTINELAEHLVGLKAASSAKVLYKDETDESSGSEDLIKCIRESLIQVLRIDDLRDDRSFQEYGLDSIMAMRLSTLLEKKLKCEIKPNLLIEYPTVKSLSTYLFEVNKKILI